MKIDNISKTRREYREYQKYMEDRKKTFPTKRLIYILIVVGVGAISGLAGFNLGQKKLLADDQKIVREKAKASPQVKKNKNLKKVVQAQEKNKTQSTKLFDYRFDLEIPKGKIISAEPKSANQHGVSALKVWNLMANNQYGALAGKKTIFLTFDDGPSNNTEAILKILNRYGIKATFFVTGSATDQNPDLVKKIYQQGSSLGQHSYNHDYHFLYPGRVLNLDNFKTDMEKTRVAIKKALGLKNYDTRMIRCPGGMMSWDEMNPLRDYLHQSKQASIDWNALSGDADGTGKSPQQLIDYFFSTVQAEMVVALMHDASGKETTVEVLPAIIERLQKEGWQFKMLV